jgi:hypothetical protein
MTPKKKQPDQHAAFIKAARDLGCDESEAAFDQTLKDLGKAQPAPKAPKRKAPKG